MNLATELQNTRSKTDKRKIYKSIIIDGDFNTTLLETEAKLPQKLTEATIYTDLNSQQHIKCYLFYLCHKANLNQLKMTCTHKESSDHKLDINARKLFIKPLKYLRLNNINISWVNEQVERKTRVYFKLWWENKIRMYQTNWVRC